MGFEHPRANTESRKSSPPHLSDVSDCPSAQSKTIRTDPKVTVKKRKKVCAGHHACFTKTVREAKSAGT